MSILKVRLIIVCSNPPSPSFVGAATDEELRLTLTLAPGHPVQLGADVVYGERTVTRDDVAACVRAVRPAFEIADDRRADYARLPTQGLQLVADNAWNEGAVLGERRTDWRPLDLGVLRGVASIDGVETGSGLGSDLMGHPLDALAWLADSIRRRGLRIRAGETAVLGTPVASRFPRPGERLEFALEGFAPIVLDVD
ncbi:MAG: hypothetical protein R3E87_10470 [Burkholderiaceae bacterium]